MNIPRDKNYPEDSVQCYGCGGHGCKDCDGKGWLTPRDHPLGRRCENSDCKKPLHPTWEPVYCSNNCATMDAW